MSNPNRYCEGCKQDHGPLYICEHYSPELKAELEAASEQHRRNLCDPEWCKQQNLGGFVLETLRWFAGVEPAAQESGKDVSSVAPPGSNIHGGKDG